jgi:NhaP-type Na+/H+ or K+/H+ antiporter
MEPISTATLTLTFALVGLVILVAALLSGLIDRSELPQVAVFLGIGAILGPFGLNLLTVELDSPVLRIVATLSLTLVLFTDAVKLDVREVRRHANLAIRILGPGTLLMAAALAFAAWALLGIDPILAAILGAALASTDPVLLRGLLRRRGVQESTKLALRLESGMNDVALLPIVAVAIALLAPKGDEATNWGQVFLELFILGPGAGIVVGLFSVATLDLVRRRIGVRRDYESLYALGVAFAAYATAEAVHGSGFLAAFAAGLTIALLDVELCDCFLEYGETTAEMALLLTFVLLGSSLIWTGLSVVSWQTLLFAAVVLFGRVVIYLGALIGAPGDRQSKLLIAWFGPHGLSSLLIVLLPVFAGIAGAESLFAICSLVVLISVVLHGGFPTILASRERRITGQLEAQPLPPTSVSISDSQLNANNHSQPAPDTNTTQSMIELQPITHQIPMPVADKRRMTIAEFQALRDQGEAVYLIDVRTERSFNNSDQIAVGALRMPPDHVTERAVEMKLPYQAWAALYCT